MWQNVKGSQSSDDHEQRSLGYRVQSAIGKGWDKAEGQLVEAQGGPKGCKRTLWDRILENEYKRPAQKQGAGKAPPQARAGLPSAFPTCLPRPSPSWPVLRASLQFLPFGALHNNSGKHW